MKTKQMKFLKQIFIFFIGLILSYNCIANTPSGDQVCGVVLSIAPTISFKVGNSSIDFAYSQFNNPRSYEWDQNMIYVQSNVSWTICILADEDLLRHPEVSNTVDIGVHKISLKQFNSNYSKRETLGSPHLLGDLSSIEPVKITGEGDDVFIIDMYMDMKSLGFLPAGRYSTGVTYSVMHTPDN